jgi:hypothetical protein
MNYKADWSFAGLPSSRIRTLSDCPPYILNSKGEERVAPGKESRSHNIYLYGWS